MAYIGRPSIVGNFVKLDAITAVNGQAAYTMQNNSANFADYSTVNQFLVSLNGTIQSPGSSFTVSGSTLTFASNLSTGDVIDFIIVFGNSLSAGTPTDATVSTAKIVDDAVTAAKINNDIISGSTELASEPADTDEFLVSDAGTLKRIDYSLIKGGGKVLQVTQGSHTSQASMSSTSFVDVSTNTNVSLTCSSTSNKVLIIANFHELYLNGSHAIKLRVTAGGTQIMRADNVVLTGTSGEKVIGETLVFLYSPSSTSAIEYKMQFASSNGSEVRVNQHSNTGLTLTLMEIEA